MQHLYIKGISFTTAIFASLILSACGSSSNSSDSKVQIKMPSVDELRKAQTKSVSAMSVIDVSRICFLVNATGPGIEERNNFCDIKRGVVSDAVKPNETVSMDVKVGENRKLEVYAFLRASASDVCPKAQENWSGSLNKYYLIGEKSGVTVQLQMPPIAIDVSVPNESRHLLASQSWPQACFPSSSMNPLGRLQSGVAVLQSSQYVVQGRVSEKSDDKVLKSTSYQIKGWMSR